MQFLFSRSPFHLIDSDPCLWLFNFVLYVRHGYNNSFILFLNTCTDSGIRSYFFLEVSLL
jgi:hypothetical protein